MIAADLGIALQGRNPSPCLTSRPFLHSHRLRGCTFGPTRSFRSLATTGDGSIKGPEPELFDRSYTMKQLKQLPKVGPEYIRLLLGPQSGGKTAILEQLQREGQNVLYIDARTHDVSTPEAFSQSLLEVTAENTSFADKVKKSGQGAVAAALALMDAEVKLGTYEDVSIKGAEISKFLAALQAKPPATSLAEITATYAEATASLAAEGHYPIIILDEASKLMTWNNKHSAEQQNLLDFFVALTKARRSAHVILATSDYAMLDWLDKKINSSFYHVEVIGNFPKSDARGFFDRVRQAAGLAAINQEEWEDIYEVCGGNAGLLRRVATSWLTVAETLADLLRPIRRNVEAGLFPVEDVGYTRQQFWDAVCAIRQAPYHAVTDADMLDVLGGGQAGKEVLQAMVKDNKLACRPYSRWAEDIPKLAFGSDGDPVVTAPLPPHLYLMQRLQKPKALESGLASDAEAIDVVDVSRALKEVIQQIAAVDSQLDAILIKERRPRGWRKEVGDLRVAKNELAARQDKLLEHLLEA